MSVENKVADTILEKTQDVTIGGILYKVSPPSVTTLILVSELVAKLPQGEVDKSDVFGETLRVAKDCRIFGEILAILIIGPKGSFMVRLFRKYYMKKLSKKLLVNLSPSQFRQMFSDLICRLELADFFGVFISLTEVNLLKPTKEMKTTASGL